MMVAQPPADAGEVSGGAADRTAHRSRGRSGRPRRPHADHGALTGVVDVVADAAALAALVTLLVAAILHLPWRQEAAVAVVATGVVLATGLVGSAALEDTVRELFPVVVFLVTIL